MVSRTFRIYGMYDGAIQHRQRTSFFKSENLEFRGRKLEFRNADITGSNDYTEVKITAENYDACERELEGQISDGYWENSRTGKVVEIKEER